MEFLWSFYKVIRSNKILSVFFFAMHAGYCIGDITTVSDFSLMVFNYSKELSPMSIINFKTLESNRFYFKELCSHEYNKS